MFARSEILKNKQAASLLTDLYSCLAASMFFSVISAISCFSLISLDLVLEAVRISIAYSSLRMFFSLPKTCRIFC